MNDIMKSGVFDWDVFKDEKNRIAVHLKTQEECDEFSKMLDEHGMKWNQGSSYLKFNNWSLYKYNTCYSNKGTFCDLDYYKRHLYHILEFSDYFKKETKQEGENKMNSITVNMENLTAEEREQLLALVKKSNKPKVWKPVDGEKYYLVSSEGSVGRDTFSKFNFSDKNRYDIGNCFRTKEEAEFAKEKLKVITELKRFAQEHNEGKIDWNDDKLKYYIYFDYIKRKIYIGNCCHYVHNDVYFTSEEIAKKAIETIGKDRLKKYYLEVED